MRAPVRWLLALAGVAGAVGAGAGPDVPPASGQAPAPGPRLEGRFAMAGRVIVATRVPGEHTGQLVLRNWTFLAPCPTGTCIDAVLVRARAGAADRLILQRRRTGYYVGSGRFYAPLRCGKRTHPRGELVPFTIAVQVVAATHGPRATATRLRASYANRSRTNRTPCFSVLGHDSASYHGHLIGRLGPLLEASAGPGISRARASGR